MLLNYKPGPEVKLPLVTVEDCCMLKCGLDWMFTWMDCGSVEIKGL